MSVKIKFLSVVIPLESINKSTLSGGFSGYLEQNADQKGKSFWHDHCLLVEWAMNPIDIQAMVEHWESLGLVSREEQDGVRKWKDLCVVDFYQGLTLKCDWLAYDAQEHTARKLGDETNEIVGPDLSGDDNPLFVPSEKMNSFSEHAVKGTPRAEKPWWKFW